MRLTPSKEDVHSNETYVKIASVRQSCVTQPVARSFRRLVTGSFGRSHGGFHYELEANVDGNAEKLAQAAAQKRRSPSLSSWASRLSCVALFTNVFPLSSRSVHAQKIPVPILGITHLPNQRMLRPYGRRARTIASSSFETSSSLSLFLSISVSLSFVARSDNLKIIDPFAVLLHELSLFNRYLQALWMYLPMRAFIALSKQVNITISTSIKFAYGLWVFLTKTCSASVKFAYCMYPTSTIFVVMSAKSFLNKSVSLVRCLPNWEQNTRLLKMMTHARSQYAKKIHTFSETKQS